MINPTYAEKLFKHLYGDINGYEVSNNARARFDGDSEDLLYGEMSFSTWEKIVKRAAPKEDAIFFDLGSGIGRVVLQSHLLFNFKKSVGVELLPGLHNKACELKSVFEKIIKPQVESHVKNRELKFLEQSIFDADLSEADFVLLSHPFKKEEDFLHLEEKFLQQLKPKTIIVTLIRGLRNPAFRSLGNCLYDFSWGKSTAHFFEV